MKRKKEFEIALNQTIQASLTIGKPSTGKAISRVRKSLPQTPSKKRNWLLEN